MLQQKNIPGSSGALLSGPVPCIDEDKARANISKMLDRAMSSGVALRPHFKTHQSKQVASWFREAGVEQCTVSSPAMADYFASDGWSDILIALPAQPGACDIYNRLSQTIRLGVVGDSLGLLEALETRLQRPLDFWIEVDAGYGRTGIPWNDVRLVELAVAAEKSGLFVFRGLLSHAGHSYQCRSHDDIREVHAEGVTRMRQAAEQVQEALERPVELSYGDTPTCSVCDDLSAFDEIRPGNFVFYDLTQREIGACDWEQIAFTVACPVIGVYPQRGEVVVHGGAVHLSKDRSSDGHFGQVAEYNDEGELVEVKGAVLTSLSQEHGVISAPDSWLEKRRVGDVVIVVPVHACLAADCFHRSL